MAPTQCPKCKAEISSATGVCPECGYRNTKSAATSESARNKMGLGGGLMVVGTIVGIYGGTGLSGNPKTISVILGSSLFLIGAVTFAIGRFK